MKSISLFILLNWASLSGTFNWFTSSLTGNSSAFNTPIDSIPNKPNKGLNYRYYEGSWDSLPDFSTLTPVATGFSPNIDVSVRPAGINDNFGFVWEGTINIPVPGNYTFETVSDDGSKIYFNSLYSSTASPLVSNDGLHGPWAPVTGTVSIDTAGLYPIAITFFEKDGEESMKVYWTGPQGSGISRQLIPDAAFTEKYTPSVDSIAPEAPENLKVVSINSNDINLTWDEARDNIGVVKYDVYVNGIKKYTTAAPSINAFSLNINSDYTFTVKAFDHMGNSSPFSVKINARTATTTNGLNYRYYEGNWDSLPDFSEMNPVRTGSSPDVDITLRPAGRNDNFAFLWEGYINIPRPGAYTFETLSDDGSKLYLFTEYNPGMQPLVSNDGLHASTSSSGTVNFTTGGPNKITISYFERDGGEKMEVYWTGPGIPRQIIPNTAFIRYSPGMFPIESIINPALETNIPEVASVQLSDIKLYPNPFTESFSVAFFNSASGNKIDVGVYDLRGRLVFDRKAGNFAAGRNAVTINLNDHKILPGIYVVKLQVNGRTLETFKIVKSK